MIEKTASLIKELQELVEREYYQEALDQFRTKCTGILEFFSNSFAHKELLLLAAKINIGNKLIFDAGMYMDQLIEEYPGIKDDFDYVDLKIRLFLLQNDYDSAFSFIHSSRLQNWNDNQSGWLDYHLGKVAFYKGEFFKANCLFEECRKLVMSSGDRYLEACASYCEGYVAFHRCFFEIAEINYQKALESFRKCGKYWSQGQAYKMLAILAYRTGEYNKAEELLIRAIKLFMRTGNKRSIINSNIGLGRINVYKGQYEEAVNLLLNNREMASELGFRREEAISCEFLGELCYHQGRYDESLTWLLEADEIADEIAPEGDHAVEVSRRLGEVYIALGRIEDAELALSKAHRLSESMHDKYELGCVLRAYGEIAYRKSDIDLAQSFFNESAVTLKLIKESFELGRTLQLSAESYKEWIQENNVDVQTRSELLNKARDNAIEALHLFSSKSLNDRAEICRELIQKLEEMINHSDKKCRFRRIRFEERHIVENGILAASESMNRVMSRAKKLAAGDMPILVSGETGTGKEIVARLLHRFSGRAEGAFVPVNCAAIPETVFESELFGYTKGAFTGALRDKAGLFEEASGGTLFLDEVTELTSRQQAKLLRALQEQSIRRVGETTERPVDIRLICASNQDVWSMVESGRMREDFYYRISGSYIEIDPLRKRKDDIIPLFTYYLCGSEGEYDIEEGLTDLLLEYHWPGNVRELINIAEELALLGENSRVIRKRDLPLMVRDFVLSEPKEQRDQSIYSLVSRDGSSNGDEDELRKRIELCIVKHNGNKTAMAKELGIGRSTLYRKLEELGIN